jgi:cytochrome c2
MGGCMKKTLILVFIAVMVSFAVSYAQKNETVTYQDFIEGKMAFEENCLECHSLEWPLKKIATREEWELTLTKMANTGAVLSKKKRRQVLEYLVAKSSFQDKCSVCHGLDRPLEKNKK